MEKMYLLGFDAGTSASKGTLCDFAGGILATAETPHPVRSPKPGYAEHDPIQDWWHDFIKIVRELLEKSGIDPKQIAGIGVSTVMAGITPVDASGTPLRNAILYGIDSRAQKQIADLNREIGEEALLSICGTLLNMESFGPKIRWIQDNEPEIFRRTHRFTFAAGFLTAKLTGRYCLDRYSARAALPMLDSEKIEWNEELTRFVCRMDQLPEIVNTTDVVGKVTHAAALETGLAEGTPVIAGTTDAGAESISAGITQPGDMMMMYGSTLFMLRLTEKMVRNSGLASGVYVLNNTARLTAGMATAGTLLRWMRDELAPDFVAAQNGGGENAYQALSHLAMNIPAGSDGLIVLPYFLGERMPIEDPNARGVFFGLTMRHTRGHIVKAIYEGIGYGINQNLNLLRQAGLSPQRVVSVGGGTKSRVWLQTVSDVCGISQVVPEVTIGASYGDAMLAGVGVGAMTPQGILRSVKIREVIRPNMENHEKYAEYKKYFSELYLRNRDIMHAL